MSAMPLLAQNHLDLLGVSGGGKGTFFNTLSTDLKQRGIDVISCTSGDIFRKKIESQEACGEGRMVPGGLMDIKEEIIEVYQNFLDKFLESGGKAVFVTDGFFRDPNQSSQLQNILGEAFTTWRQSVNAQFGSSQNMPSGWHKTWSQLNQISRVGDYFGQVVRESHKVLINIDPERANDRIKVRTLNERRQAEVYLNYQTRLEPLQRSRLQNLLRHEKMIAEGFGVHFDSPQPHPDRGILYSRDNPYLPPVYPGRTPEGRPDTQAKALMRVWQKELMDAGESFDIPNCTDLGQVLRHIGYQDEYRSDGLFPHQRQNRTEAFAHRMPDGQWATGKVGNAMLGLGYVFGADGNFNGARPNLHVIDNNGTFDDFRYRCHETSRAIFGPETTLPPGARR